MKDLETVLCRLHLRSQPRYPRFTLCPECRSETPHEARVVEAVVNYFSKSKFSEFFIETEHEIRIGTYKPRPDIVLFDEAENRVAIAECKREGTIDNEDGVEQLKSYLTASDVQFGIFANSTEPDEWIFFENLRRYNFEENIPRVQFETEIVANRSIESIREEKDKLVREVDQVKSQYTWKVDQVESSNKQLNELKDKIEQAKEQFACLKKDIGLRKKERGNLNAEIAQNFQQADVLSGLKLKSTRDNLKEEVDYFRTIRNQLQNEITTSEQQRRHLLEEVNSLERSRGELKRNQNKIKSDQETLKKEKENWQISLEKQKKMRSYLEKINADLDGRIKHKTPLIRELESRLDELELAFALKSVYGQIEKELKRLDELESEIARKQRLAQADQEKRAAYERNSVEINQKRQQCIQVSQKRESVLKQLRVVVNRLKTTGPEQRGQIEENRRQLVQNLRKQKRDYEQLTEEINQLKAKLKLKTEIREKHFKCWQEGKNMYPTYIQMRVEIDNLKAEKSKLEAEIGYRIFMLQARKD